MIQITKCNHYIDDKKVSKSIGHSKLIATFAEQVLSL